MIYMSQYLNTEHVSPYPCVSCTSVVGTDISSIIFYEFQMFTITLTTSPVQYICSFFF
jgi:hypothetical protein